MDCPNKLYRTWGLIATPDVRFSNCCCAEMAGPKWFSFAIKLPRLVDSTYKLTFRTYFTCYHLKLPILAESPTLVDSPNDSINIATRNSWSRSEVCDMDFGTTPMAM